MNPHKDLDVLATVAMDSSKRYHHAALDVGKEYLARFFNQQSAIRKRHADELQAARTRLGSLKDESGSVAGTLDTAAMDFSVVMSMGDTGVVDWCRKDAESAAEKYQKALADELPPEVAAIVRRQLGEIRSTVASLEEVLREYGGPRS